MKGTAFITGSSDRIGLAIAESLAHKGFTIALHYNTSEEKAHESLQRIRQIQPKSSLYKADLTDLSAVEKLIPSVYADHPDLCVLINNASVFEKYTILDTDKDILQRDMRVHYMAPLLLIREFAKHVKEGVVINMLDARVRQNSTGDASYLISKKALASLTEIAALELAPTIRVNGIAPGAILPPPGKSQDYLNSLAKDIPLGRPGSLSDITHAVETILENDYLTGQIMYIDGGMFL